MTWLFFLFFSFVLMLLIFSGPLLGLLVFGLLTALLVRMMGEVWSISMRPVPPLEQRRHRHGRRERVIIVERPAGEIRRRSITQKVEPPPSEERETVLPTPNSYLLPLVIGLGGLAVIRAVPEMAIWVSILGIIGVKIASQLATRATSRLEAFWQGYNRWVRQRRSQLGSWVPWLGIAALAGTGTLLVSQMTDETQFFGAILLTLVSCITAGRLVRGAQQAEERIQALAKELETTLLRLAAERDGTLTATDVAMNTDLSLTQAGEVLDALHVRGLVQMDVHDDGVITYTFPELAHQAEETRRRETGTEEREQREEIDLRW
ncbi:MAG TPA: hypothetical protein EYP85_08430 [Armatimonadetes bacterium]|nr:hypothetical protein [Armatimonadota bacterium]